MDQYQQAREGLKVRIRSYVPIDDESLEAIVNQFEIYEFPRHTFLLKEGDRCNFWGFVHSGLLRAYTHTSQGDEHTNWFIREGGFIADYPSLLSTTPSKVNLVALEDTITITVPPQKLQALYTEFPLFDKFVRILLENILVNVKERILFRIQLDATDRYEYFVRTQPELMQRVPLKYIASFLSITESSLSRIRRHAHFLPFDK